MKNYELNGEKSANFFLLFVAFAFKETSVTISSLVSANARAQIITNLDKIWWWQLVQHKTDTHMAQMHKLSKHGDWEKKSVREWTANTEIKIIINYNRKCSSCFLPCRWNVAEAFLHRSKTRMFLVHAHKWASSSKNLLKLPKKCMFTPQMTLNYIAHGENKMQSPFKIMLLIIELIFMSCVVEFAQQPGTQSLSFSTLSAFRCPPSSLAWSLKSALCTHLNM